MDTHVPYPVDVVFQNQMAPAEDLVKAPVGLLALDCMLYFAQNHGENYIKVKVDLAVNAN